MKHRTRSIWTSRPAVWTVPWPTYVEVTGGFLSKPEGERTTSNWSGEDLYIPKYFGMVLASPCARARTS
jgi:hypothetical protein